MSETSITAPELLRPQETIAEAQEAMLDSGAGFVEGFLSPDQCAAAVSSLSEAGFMSLGRVDFRYVQGREKYADDLPGATPVPEVLWQTADTVMDSFDSFATSHPEFADWSQRAGDAGRRLIKAVRELVRYPEGLDVKQHLDQPDGEFPTQALLTLSGEGEMELFTQPDDIKPHMRIPLKPGTLVFLRGNEVEPLKQLSHAVKHTKGPRVLFTIGAFSEELMTMRQRPPKRQALQERGPQRTGRIRRLANTVLKNT